MGIEENKATVIAHIQAVRSRGRDELVPELLSPGYGMHGPGLPPGVAGFLAMDEETRTAFPDFHFELDDVIAEGERVVVHWTIRGTHLGTWHGISPTGNAIVRRGLAVFTVRDGRVTGLYGYSNDLDAPQQVGVLVPG